MGKLKILPQRILSPFAYSSLIPVIGGYENIDIVRTATKVVAASDSPDASKAGADYVCPGAADDETIQAAIDACPVTGKVLVLEGTINTTSTIKILKAIEFECLATIHGAAGIDLIQIGDASNDARFCNVKVGTIGGPSKATGGKGIVINQTAYGHIQWNLIWHCSTGVEVDALAGKTSENRLVGGGVVDCKDAILFSDSAFMMEGNWILASIFSCDHGVTWTAGGDSIFTQFSGVVDNAGVGGSTDIVDAVGQNLITPYFYRVSSSTIHASTTVISPMKISLPNVDLQYHNYINLISNGGFEAGDPPAGWTSSNVTASRSTDYIKIGSYSAKLISSGAALAQYYRSIPDYARYKGREVTLGAWIYNLSTNDGDQQLRIYDGVTVTDGEVIDKDDAWHWVTVTKTLSASATQLRPGYRIATTGENATVYPGVIMLVEGDSCPAYLPRPDDNIICHHTAAYTLSAYETGHVVHTNLGASGAVPLTLPQTVSAGFTCHFAVMAAFELRVDPGAAGAIYINGAKQTDNMYITADDEAESIDLVADGNGDWVARNMVGTWGVEA